MRPDAPAPNRRRGPRPLLMHLTPRGTDGTPLPPSSSACMSLNGSLLSGTNLDPDLIAGIAAYRRHPWQRDLPDPPTVWQVGDARLLDFGVAPGPPVLFVPSLVNRAYVLDLAPGRSMMRWLAAHGVRPLLLDWGWPGATERAFTLSHYVTQRLESAMASVGAPVVLAGYCMGGLLALAAALRRPGLVRGLALLATPWDFHAEHQADAARLGATLPLFEPLLDTAGALPIDALQALFTTLDPSSIAAKYAAFGRLDQHSEAARGFVAIEDWLNDGVPLAAPVAREALGGWYGANAPARGQWQVAGAPVDPAALRVPSWVAAPARDRIVPPGSALPLARLVPGAVLHRPAAGHIGMAAGPRAEAVLWQPLLGWLRGL